MGKYKTQLENFILILDAPHRKYTDEFVGVPEVPTSLENGPDLMPTEPRIKGILAAQARVSKQMSQFEATLIYGRIYRR